jgi:hypothetical protein
VVYENYVNLHGLGPDLLKIQGLSCKMAFSLDFRIIFVSPRLRQRVGPRCPRGCAVAELVGVGSCSHSKRQGLAVVHPRGRGQRMGCSPVVTIVAGRPNQANNEGQ